MDGRKNLREENMNVSVKKVDSLTNDVEEVKNVARGIMDNLFMGPRSGGDESIPASGNKIANIRNTNNETRQILFEIKDVLSIL